MKRSAGVVPLQGRERQRHVIILYTYARRVLFYISTHEIIIVISCFLNPLTPNRVCPAGTCSLSLSRFELLLLSLYK